MTNANPGIRLLRQTGLVLVVVFGLISILATGGNGDSTPDDGPIGPQSQDTATINGSVTGSGGIAGVAVSAGGRSVSTDLNGFYELTEVPVPDDGLLVLTYEKAGYATFQRTIPVAVDETYSVTAQLLQYHYSEQVDASSEQNLNVGDPDDPGGDPLAQLSFPAGSLGSGNVTVNVAMGDPTTEEGRPTFPGDYMAATTQGGDADTPLESVVFTEITVRDADGAEITEVSEPVTVTMRLPDSLQTAYSAGDTIEWWSYDETNGTWIREDADPATPDFLDDAAVISQGGVLYAQAKVTHFTWWNVDAPMDQHACVCVTVVGVDDLPVAGKQLIAEGITYNGRSRPADTDSDGNACVTVKRSSDSVTEQIRLFVESGSVKFHYNVTDAAEGDVDTDAIFTPTIEGSTVYNTGQCVDLANNIALRYDGRVTGRVTLEDSGDPVAGYVINSDFGPTATSDSDGNYQLEVPLGVPVTLFAVGQAAQTVTVESADTPQVVNFVIANRDPVIDGISRDPQGNVSNNQAVNLTATAHDDDGDAISYSWSADQGSFNTTTAAAVTWTAPASGAGTATLTLTVADGKGGETSQNIAIVYAGGVPSGDSLSFIFKDEFGSDQPVAGVVVALYNTDNRTIAQTKTSGADGLVDFGDIGRSRATFTIVYESDGDFFAERYIDSFVEMQVADDIVYYTEDNIFGDDIGSGTTVATVDYSLSAVPADAGRVSIEPGFAWWSYPFNTGQLTNQPVLESYLQDDGKLSLLAKVNSATNTDLLIGYGFLLDQTVSDGATYDIPLDRTPVTTAWSTQPATDMSYVHIIGYRRGVPYAVAGTPSSQVLGSSGTLQVPMEFPVDHYWMFGVTESDSSGVESAKRYTNLPQSVELAIPDYSFSNVVFNDATNTLSWSVSGASPRDLVDIEMGAATQTDQTIYWSIVMDAGATSWQVMALPAPADSWIDTATLDNVFEASVAVVDFDFVSGMDEIWQFFISGGSFDETANQFLSGWTDVPDQGLSAAEVPTPSMLKAELNTPIERKRDRTAGLSKLRRQ